MHRAVRRLALIKPRRDRTDSRCMDIAQAAQLSTDLKQSQLQQQVQYAVLQKQLSAQKQQGAAAVQLIEAAAKLAPAPVQNGRLDTLG